MLPQLIKLYINKALRDNGRDREERGSDIEGGTKVHIYL